MTLASLDAPSLSTTKMEHASTLPSSGASGRNAPPAISTGMGPFTVYSIPPFKMLTGGPAPTDAAMEMSATPRPTPPSPSAKSTSTTGSS